jgi:hypothetical protein
MVVIVALVAAWAWVDATDALQGPLEASVSVFSGMADLLDL